MALNVKKLVVGKQEAPEEPVFVSDFNQMRNLLSPDILSKGTQVRKMDVGSFVVGKQEALVKKQAPVLVSNFRQLRDSLVPNIFSKGTQVRKMDVGSLVIIEPVYTEPALVAPGAYDYVEELTDIIAAPEVAVLTTSTKPFIQKPKTSDYLRDLTIHK